MVLQWCCNGGSHLEVLQWCCNGGSHLEVLQWCCNGGSHLEVLQWCCNGGSHLEVLQSGEAERGVRGLGWPLSEGVGRHRQAPQPTVLQRRADAADADCPAWGGGWE